MKELQTRTDKAESFGTHLARLKEAHLAATKTVESTQFRKDFVKDVVVSLLENIDTSLRAIDEIIKSPDE